MGLDVWQILRWPTFRGVTHLLCRFRRFCYYHSPLTFAVTNQHLKAAAMPMLRLLMPMLRQNILRIGDKKMGNQPFGILCSFPTSNRTNHPSKEGYPHGFPRNEEKAKLKKNVVSWHQPSTFHPCRTNRDPWRLTPCWASSWCNEPDARCAEAVWDCTCGFSSGEPTPSVHFSGKSEATISWCSLFAFYPSQTIFLRPLRS